MQYISVSVLTPMGLPEGEDLKRSETIQTSFKLMSIYCPSLQLYIGISNQAKN